ncbi:hypothetical protein QFZ63_000535 [Streptomyces sp. B3I7]|nr:hypothetical protein [Streptomyces sp. B3I7]
MNTFLADSVGTCEIAGKKIARPGFGAMRLTGLGIRGEPGDRAECGTGRTRRGRVAGAPPPGAGRRQPRTRRPFRKNQAAVIPPYEAGPGRPHDLPPSSCPRSAWDRERAALEAGDNEAAVRTGAEAWTSPKASDDVRAQTAVMMRGQLVARSAHGDATRSPPSPRSVRRRPRK